MRGVRDFQLVLCADVSDDMRECSVRKLKQVVAVEKAKTACDGISPEPLVFHSSPESYCQFDSDPLFSP
jgi:hypothetical protein